MASAVAPVPLIRSNSFSAMGLFIVTRIQRR